MVSGLWMAFPVGEHFKPEEIHPLPLTSLNKPCQWRLWRFKPCQWDLGWWLVRAIEQTFWEKGDLSQTPWEKGDISHVSGGKRTKIR